LQGVKRGLPATISPRGTARAGARRHTEPFEAFQSGHDGAVQACLLIGQTSIAYQNSVQGVTSSARNPSRPLQSLSLRSCFPSASFSRKSCAARLIHAFCPIATAYGG
jgi:hypothetical protein